jgi:capsular polysaccharide export protein
MEVNIVLVMEESNVQNMKQVWKLVKKAKQEYENTQGQFNAPPSNKASNWQEALILSIFGKLVKFDRSFQQTIEAGKESSTNQEFVDFLNHLFEIRNSFFLRAKKLQEPKYSFKIHDPYEIFRDPGGLENFNLVGDNWLEPNSDKPIAVLWGFNNWKLGFISDYLPEFRTAFAPRKFLGSMAVGAVSTFPIKPKVFIAWGYTESISIRAYAFMNKIPIWRMEDGFLRSAELGANHATPYSLVLDKTGLYYNSEVPCDLENLLNSYNFAQDLQLMESAERCLTTMQNYRLSKYNEPFINRSDLFPIKLRKRVAVIGQVEHDAAVRLGNPDNWKMENIVLLAKYENPGAEIIYRPHPETYQQFQKGGSQKKRIEQIAQIVAPDRPLPEFLDSVDHIYTISSLSGLEAILRDIKVTVLGTPFYAGWGLTDDRAKMPRRNRKVSKIELFAAVYLKYPLYLADLHNVEDGFLTACLHIQADREISYHETIANTLTHTMEPAKLVAQSDYWPKLFFGKNLQEQETKMVPPFIIQKCLGQIDFSRVLNQSSGKIFQATLLYAMCGVLEEEHRNHFLKIVRKYIDRDVLNTLLCDLAIYRPGPYVSLHLSWLLEQNGEDEIARNILRKALQQNHSAQENIESQQNKISDDLVVESTPPKRQLISQEEAEIQSQLIDSHIANKNFEQAKQIAFQLLLLGYTEAKTLNKLAKIAELQFDSASAGKIADFSRKINIAAHDKESTVIDMKSKKISEPADVEEFLDTLVLGVVLRPDTVDLAITLLNQYPDYIDTEKYEKLIISLARLSHEFTIKKALAYIAIDQAEKAIRILEEMANRDEKSERHSIVYSQALSHLGHVTEARKVMDAIRNISSSSMVYRESLRLCVLAGDYKAGLRLIREAQDKKIELGDMLPRKILFGSRLVQEALGCFRENSANIMCKMYYKEKYYDCTVPSSAKDSILALSIFGPGDEIRFASIYNLLKSHLPHQQIQISCDPRLYSLLSASFPQFEFIPVRRLRAYERYDLERYNRLPGNELLRVLDNTGFEAAEKVDQIAVITDFLHLCLPDYDAFLGTPYLIHDAQKATEISKKLPKTDLKLVGLSWRSSLTTRTRNEHYLTVEDLEPIFQIEGIQFVNLQYDECSEELAWVEAHFPEKLINLDEIDQYNDFDSVAALMKCLDLVIAPATTVVELAGALGCPTWLLSNSSELHWRKINDAGTDVWHNSITHVEGAVLGNKKSLVHALHSKLNHYVAKEVQAKDTILA